ncbi:MAG TPA: cyanophycinase [Flavobacteriales bacterium]|nr:cyanophycinase [Flavobacteriales bacterium]
MNTPKGKLIVIGGAVNKGDEEQLNSDSENQEFFEIGILARMLRELEGDNARIEVITTASEIPVEVGAQYITAFNRLGHTNIDVIHIRSREDTENEAYLERARTCAGVLFSGGNQLRLTTIFGGTEFIKILLRRYDSEPIVIAGTSAGAMAMSNTMIQGSSSKALIKNEVQLSRGLGFIKDVTFDSHFVKRGRFSRLFQAVAMNPVCLGIGLGEDTGLLITEGHKMEAIGSGLVIIVDGENIRYTNVASIGDKEPISIENLSVHILVQNNGFLLNDRKFLASY